MSRVFGSPSKMSSVSFPIRNKSNLKDSAASNWTAVFIWPVYLSTDIFYRSIMNSHRIYLQANKELHPQGREESFLAHMLQSPHLTNNSVVSCFSFIILWSLLICLIMEIQSWSIREMVCKLKLWFFLIQLRRRIISNLDVIKINRNSTSLMVHIKLKMSSLFFVHQKSQNFNS